MCMTMRFCTNQLHLIFVKTPCNIVSTFIPNSDKKSKSQRDYVTCARLYKLIFHVIDLNRALFPVFFLVCKL